MTKTEDTKNTGTFTRKNPLQWILYFAIFLLVIYLLFPSFRNYLSCQGIDPNFIVGFLTMIALVMTLIQSLEDRKYTYNLQRMTSIEDKGLSIIAKLIMVRGKAMVYAGTLKMIDSAMKHKKLYKDSNEVFSKADVEKEMELIAAYADTYFPEIKSDWNELTDKISRMGSLCTNTLLNYNENHLLLGNIGFSNDVLDNIETSIKEADILVEEIDEMSLKMRDSIVGKINTATGHIRKSFDFKI